jgi:hypothetical protein
MLCVSSGILLAVHSNITSMEKQSSSKQFGTFIALKTLPLLINKHTKKDVKLIEAII